MFRLNLIHRAEIMQAILLVVLLIFCWSSALGQQNLSREEYISTFSELAMREMARVGIPASIKLAQGCLESNNGNSSLATKGNNHFGIKCHDWQGKKSTMTMISGKSASVPMPRYMNPIWTTRFF